VFADVYYNRMKPRLFKNEQVKRLFPRTMCGSVESDDLSSHAKVREIGKNGWI